MGSFNVRLSIFWVIWTAIILVSGFQVYRNTQKFSEAAGMVAHTREVLEAAQSTLTTLVDAEAGQRGYLITGNPISLERYRTALARLQGEINRVLGLVQDNPRQVARIQYLKGLIGTRVEEMAETLALNEKNPESARRAVTAQEVGNSMAPIQQQFETTRNEELILLSGREKANRSAHHAAILSGVLAGTFGLTGMAGLSLLVIRANRNRDRLERDREQHRQLLLVTLRSLGDALITTDATGAVEFMNTVAETLTGWKLEEAVGEPLGKVFNVIDELTRTPAVSPVGRVLREGVVLGLANPTALVDRVGHEVPIENSAAPIKDDAGEVVGVALVFRDVTENRKAERALVQSERRFRKLTELSPDAIWVNRGDRIEMINSEAMRLMGAARADQVIGMTPLQIFHPDCHERVVERLWAVQQGQTVHLSEETIVRLDGTLRQVEVSSAPFEDSQGPAIQVVLRDVTTRKQTERALVESEERFRRLFESAPVPYALFNKSGQTLALNTRFRETFGYDLEDIPDADSWWRRAYPDPEVCRKVKEHWEALAATESQVSREIVVGVNRQVACKDGQVRMVQVSGLMQSDQLLATFFDLTDRLREEEERRKVEERMVQAQRLEALGVLVAGIAHNFNNIMAIIMGTVSMQEEVVKDPSELQALSIIDTACQRGRGLVRSLTHFARPSVPSKVPFELGALVAELRLLLEHTARKNIAIVAALSEEPTWVLGDPGSFQSALMNLSLNSLDAMPHGGTLTLRMAIPQADMVEVSVEDNGEGMRPEILAHATEPFFTTKPVDKGTGLGLSIAHGVVTAHGGTMTIRSTPGQGTQVVLRIPRHLVPVRETMDLVPKGTLGLSKVLVVDDEEEVRAMLARMLTMAGSDQVKTVATGQEALVSLDSGDIPDLIVLDHNMPGLDGIQTLALIRAAHRGIPILISSGEPDIKGREGFIQKDVAIISKPFTLDEIQKTLVKLGIGAGHGGP